MSIFSREVWTIFYGPNEYGPIIFKFSIIVAAFDALYMMMCSTLQGLNKTKLVYIAVFLGLGINLVLDLPLMYLFNNIGIYPYYGAITATLIGCLISFIIPLITLKRKYHINYTETWVRLPKLMISYGSIIILSTLYEFFIKNVTNRFLLIPILGIFGILLLILYYLFNKKELDIVVGNRIANLFKKGKK
jgi:O-antigen/teichoic acid export membrane protein